MSNLDGYPKYWFSRIAANVSICILLKDTTHSYWYTQCKLGLNQEHRNSESDTLLPTNYFLMNQTESMFSIDSFLFLTGINTYFYASSPPPPTPNLYRKGLSVGLPVSHVFKLLNGKCYVLQISYIDSL